MKKIVLFLIAITLMLGVFSVFAYAEQSAADVSAENAEEGLTPNDTFDGAQQQIDAENEIESDTFFDSLYTLYEENKGELFSLVSAVVSLILVFVYRKGLIPVLKGGLSLIEGQVKTLREVSADAKAENAKTSEDTLALGERIAALTAELQKTLERVDAQAADAEGNASCLEELRTCVLWQAELLGEVFLASSLPEYSKQRVSRTLALVRDTLSPSESVQDT